MTTHEPTQEWVFATFPRLSTSATLGDGARLSVNADILLCYAAHLIVLDAGSWVGVVIASAGTLGSAVCNMIYPKVKWLRPRARGNQHAGAGCSKDSCMVVLLLCNPRSCLVRCSSRLGPGQSCDVLHETAARSPACGDHWPREGPFRV